MSNTLEGPLCVHCKASGLLPAILLSIFALIGSTKLLAAGSAATVTTVSVPSDPVPSGQLVTLTATVTAAGAPVTVGYVDFREGNVVVGQGALQADGTASLAVQFPPGQFSITARFDGSNAGQPSVSQPATLTQLGTSGTVLSASPNPDGSITYSATVTGSQPVAPTGTVTFIDRATGQRFGTVNLQPGTAQSGLQPGLLPPAVGGNWFRLVTGSGIVEGDFNGDGIPDYAMRFSSPPEPASKLSSTWVTPTAVIKRRHRSRLERTC